jgi:hypothetical protein
MIENQQRTRGNLVKYGALLQVVGFALFFVGALYLAVPWGPGILFIGLALITLSSPRSRRPNRPKGR